MEYRYYGPLSEDEKWELVGLMAAYTHTLIGDRDPTDCMTWKWALRQIGCDVVVWRDARWHQVAELIVVPGGSDRYPLGLVRFNLARDRLTRSRGLAHEFAHALLRRYVPEVIYGVDIVSSYHDDGRSVSHQLARLFEKMMVG